MNRVSSHNRGQTAGPGDTVRAKDGWVMRLVIGQYQFDRWCQMVGERPASCEPSWFGPNVGQRLLRP